jgi:hypothetical protein
MHVNDLFVTSASANNLEKFENYMRGVYCEIKVNKGEVIDYIGMTFDFYCAGSSSHHYGKLRVRYPRRMWDVAASVDTGSIQCLRHEGRTGGNCRGGRDLPLLCRQALILCEEGKA